METPLTPLEFARRARKLYPERVAVIDGDSSWTYAQFLDRIDGGIEALNCFDVCQISTICPAAEQVSNCICYLSHSLLAVAG